MQNNSISRFLTNPTRKASSIKRRQYVFLILLALGIALTFFEDVTANTLIAYQLLLLCLLVAQVCATLYEASKVSK